MLSSGIPLLAFARWGKKGVSEGACVHECMREADFGAVDSAIAGGLEDGEEIVVARIENDALNGRLQ